ncbi:molybdenum cofactor guanylyltransferase MobA [Solimonas soli]|uniref:molybdenum cofactor guanylyltransferase MobA n=1 Tax=Solimonas soli TaxID=413479 RepID=UPI0004B2EBDD|nr:molybdenum cofactor guanylyltransferase MobA [Solimonas soli]
MRAQRGAGLIAASRPCAVVLAGGRGLRMGGADKGLAELDGKPLVAHLLDALRPQAAALLINANRHGERYAAFGVPVVADPWPDFRGPLAGIAAAFAAIEHDWLLAAPCDTPGLPADLAAQLMAAAQAGRRDAAYAVVDGDPVYPLCLLHRRLAAPLRTALEAGHYAVGRWLAAQGAVAVNIRGWCGTLMNLNTPERLAAAQHHPT